jgi:hypothetical protein
MKHLLPISPLLLLTIVGAAKPQQGFTFDGQPIHPMSVQPLIGDLADEQPAIAAVDLDGSAKNKSNRSEAKAEGGTVTAQNGNGFVAYRHIGTTPGGLGVLVVMVNGCGSGVFEDALWVKIVRDRVWEDGKQRNRTMMLKVGAFTLGDRDNGQVKLLGDKLFIGKSRYREKDTTIALE